MTERCARLLISGRVQGVGYRAWFEQEARRFGVNGWVRNRRDGGVEALCLGSDEGVARLERAATRGPAGALVSEVRSEPAEAGESGMIGFTIRPTA